jgi:Uma2 family endonuclease
MRLIRSRKHYNESIDKPASAKSGAMEPMTVAVLPSLNQVQMVNGDVRTIQTNRTWGQFRSLKQGFENTRGVRLAYYKGTIEILMLGLNHELFKSIIGFLIEAFLFHQKIEFTPTGSATQEKDGIVSAEADESYEIQGFRLAIEVDFTHGSISKLERYAVLGTNEVWIWEDGLLDIYWLDGDEYHKADRSQIPALAPIDRSLMSDCILIGETSRIQAGEKLLSSVR